MRRWAFSLTAALSLFVAGAAAAQSVQLTNNQMDKVSAGFLEIDRGNTGTTVLSMFFRPSIFDPTPNTINCSSCYLQINSPVLSIASQFGPGPLLATFPP